MGGAVSLAGVVARAQWRVLLRDGRLRLLILATLIIAVAGLAGGAARDTRLADERAQLNAADAELWTAQGAVNPHMAAHFGRYVSKPVSPLTFFDPGVTEQLGTVARLEAHVQQPPRHRPAEGGASLNRFGGFSPALALQILGPLLIILAGFSVFSGDRARILLRQELAGGAPRLGLLGGRYAALSLAATLMVAPVLIITLVLAARAGGAVLAAALSISVGYVLFTLFWVGFTLGVSALCRSARTSLIVLLSVWLGTTFLVPRLASDVAARLAPSPTSVAFKADIRTALEAGPSGHDSADARLAALRQETLEHYGVDRIEDLPVSWDGIALQEGERIATEIGNEHYERLWASYERQGQIRRAFAGISPLLALKSWSSGLAGSDAAAHVDFTRAIEAYRFSFVDLLNEDIASNAVGQNAFSYEASPELLESVPPFTYSSPPLEERFGRLWLDGIILMVWWIAAIVLAGVAVRRLRPS